MIPIEKKSVFEILPSDGYKLIKFLGRLENDSARSFSDALPDLLSDAPTDFILNFENVSELSHVWIRSLMQLSQSLKAVNKNLGLICVSEGVAKFLKQEGVEGRLRAYTNLRTALVEMGLASAQVIDVNFINPFLDATIKVLEMQTSTKVTPGKVFKKPQREKFLGDISGVIGLVSDAFTGSVVISFPEKTFLKIISRMLGEEHTKISKDIEDGAGEITNIIFGQAKVALNERGYGIKTALPSVVAGSDHSILQMTNGPRMVIPFESDAGPFFIEVCMST